LCLLTTRYADVIACQRQPFIPQSFVSARVCMRARVFVCTCVCVHVCVCARVCVCTAHHSQQCVCDLALPIISFISKQKQWPSIRIKAFFIVLPETPVGYKHTPAGSKNKHTHTHTHTHTFPNIWGDGNGGFTLRAAALCVFLKWSRQAHPRSPSQYKCCCEKREKKKGIERILSFFVFFRFCSRRSLNDVEMRSLVQVQVCLFVIHSCTQ